MAAERTDAGPARRSDGPRPAPPGPLAPVLAGAGSGDRLAPQVAAPVSRALGIDVSAVRVHTGAAARRAAAGLGARAFAVGQDVYLGPGADPTDVGLMAHEVAHTVQQRAAAPAVRLFTPGSSGAHEREAEAARGAVSSGGSLVVAGHAPVGVQRQEGAVEDQGFAMGLVERFAPDLAPIIRKGVVEWLREQLLDAMRALVDLVMSPVRQAAVLMETLQTHFGELVAWIRVAGERIARGDCGPLAEAAAKIQQVVEGVTAPVVDRVKQIATKIGAFFTDLWNRVGAPIWDNLKTLGGEAWKRIQWFAGAVWDSTAPIRRVFTAAWNWIKLKLGLTDDGGGVIGWLQEKAAAAWAWVKSHLEPYKKQIAVIAGVLVLLSPAGPILVIGAGIAGLVMAVRWIAKNLAGGGAGAVQGRRELLDRIIPAAKGAVAGVGGALRGVAATLLARLESVVGALAGFASSLAAGVLRVLVALVDWLVGLARRLAAWAEQKVLALAGWVEDVLARLSRLLAPVRRVLEKVGRVLENVIEVVAMVAEKAWNAIPACIRNPVVDFLTTHILKKIPLIAQLVEVPNVWTKMKDLVVGLVRGLFRGGSLRDALEKVLRFALEVLKVPVQLAQAVWTKAQGAFDLISRDPTGFLRNVLLALKGGLSLFWENILKHLLRGVTDWLFAVARQAGITPPAELSFKAVLGFVLEVLGISMAKVFALLEKRLAKPVVDKLRVAGRLLAGAWEWVTALITEGPAGLWRHIQDQLSGLWDTVKGFVVDWLIGTFIEEAMKKLISFLDPTGIMAVVNGFLAVWRAIESAIEYLGQLLEMLRSFLDGVADIAAGAIGGAASRLEKLLAAGLSVAIGFLANQFPRLKRLGSYIREMVEKVQKRVEAAMEKLIDKAITAGRGLLDALGGAGSAAGVLEEDSFDVEGAPHHVVVRSEPGPRVIAIASTPERGWVEFLDLHASSATTDDTKKTVSQARTKAAAIETLATSVASAKNDGERKERLTRLHARIGEFLVLIKPLLKGRPLSRLVDRYRLEGQVGRYDQLSDAKGDKIEKDHQPPASVIKHAASLPEFADRAIQSIATGHAIGGWAINLHAERHAQGLSWRNRDSYVSVAKAALDAITGSGAAVTVRRKVVDKLVDMRAKEAAAILAAIKGRDLKRPAWADIAELVKKGDVSEAEAKAMVDHIAGQIEVGEGRITSQELGYERQGAT